MSKSGLFVFFVGFGMSAAAFMMTGLGSGDTWRGAAYLFAIALTLYGLAGVLTGQDQEDPQD